MQTWKVNIIVPTLLAIMTCPGMAEVSVKIRSIDVDDNVYTPYFTVETEQDHDQGASQRWIRLSVNYSTRGGWINELTIQHLALAGLNFTCPSPVILTEEVTYINIGPGNHVSYVYMHPNSVKRYKSRAKELDVAVEFIINGEVIATERSNRNSKGDWTTDPKNHIHEGYLLSESETPFWFINYDYKEIIKHTPHPNSTNACRTKLAK
jgi:hypothetical protein